MAEEEEWLLAAEAVRLLKQVFNSEHAAKIAICKRAHSGLVRASAQRLVIDDKTRDNVEVPKEFWWAEGGDTLKQDWAIGDFNTWIGLDKVSGNPHLSAGKIQIKAFAVKFAQRYPRGSRRQMLQLTQSVAEGIKVLQLPPSIFDRIEQLNELKRTFQGLPAMFAGANALKMFEPPLAYTEAMKALTTLPPAYAEAMKALTTLPPTHAEAIKAIKAFKIDPLSPAALLLGRGYP